MSPPPTMLAQEAYHGSYPSQTEGRKVPNVVSGRAEVVTTPERKGGTKDSREAENIMTKLLVITRSYRIGDIGRKEQFVANWKCRNCEVMSVVKYDETGELLMNPYSNSHVRIFYVYLETLHQHKIAREAPAEISKKQLAARKMQYLRFNRDIPNHYHLKLAGVHDLHT
ncbi:hypothetical protein B0H17DRAFT_1150809 [Mycena rosella]|uniref:Uncharacterized protein n=1 Tax=Mycena rosella TaxID=1033263 RepID=A0AAD7BQK3_MYCRO|nr:hypothetical protein B0H17DRAFT_1150809 [Mycena rosella]